MKNTSFLIIFLLVLVGQNAFTNRISSQARYSMEDLISLQNSQDYSEILDHIFDIPPSKRNEQWKNILYDASIKLSEILNNSLTYDQRSYEKLYQLTLRPYLKNNQIFYDSFLRISFRESLKCFENGPAKDRYKCILKPFELLKTYADEEHFVKFYNLFNTYAEEKNLNYQSTFELFILTLIPNIRFDSITHICQQEKIQNIYLRKMMTNHQFTLSESCFKQLSDPLLEKVASLKLNEKIAFLKKFKSMAPGSQFISNYSHLSLFLNFVKGINNLNYKSIHILLGKLKNHPGVRENLIELFKNDQILNTSMMKTPFRYPMLREINIKFPELINWYYQSCRSSKIGENFSSFCLEFDKINQREKFI